MHTDVSAIDRICQEHREVMQQSVTMDRILDTKTLLGEALSKRCLVE